MGLDDDKKRALAIVENWRKVLRHAWSVRFMVIGAGLTAGATVLPLIAPAIPPAWLFGYGLVTFVVIVAALCSRFVVQAPLAPEAQDGAR